MVKLLVFAALSPFILFGCSSDFDKPDMAAKAFVTNYFKPDHRDELIKMTSEAASEKLVFENKKSELLDRSAIVRELPSGFYLSDSSRVDDNHFRFSFSIQYSGNLLQNEQLLVFVKRYGKEWKISDYRFAKGGE